MLQIARFVSIAGHPLVLVPFSIALVTGRWTWALFIAATTMIPLAAFVLFQMRRGSWTDFDVSRPEQRRGLYRAALPLLAIAGLVLFFTGAAPPLLQGVATAAGMLLIGVLLSRWLKVSLHLMFATFCAVTVCDQFPVAIVPAAAVLLVLAWSRLKLERHTMPEVLVGFAIGLAGGLVALFL
ncbi:MAG TPA: hypothetical protein VGF69_09245 [Thermoanaerobaculia bacterium]|jgi:membrane-associated phospholipid phosphatase